MLKRLLSSLLLSKAPRFPSAPPGHQVETHCNYSCPSSLLLVLTVQLMPPMMLLILLSVLFLLFSPSPLTSSSPYFHWQAA